MSNMALAATVPAFQNGGAPQDPGKLASVIFQKQVNGVGAFVRVAANSFTVGAGPTPAQLTANDTTSAPDGSDVYTCFFNNVDGLAGALSNRITAGQPGIPAGAPGVSVLSGTFSP